MRRAALLSSLLALLAGVVPAARAELTLAGTEFWAVDLQNGGLATAEPFGILVANPHAFDVVVRIEGATGPLASAVVGAGRLEAFSFDRSRVVAGTVVVPHAYHVVASAPVRVQQVNPLTPNAVHSHDVSTLLPVESFGTAYRPLSREGYLDTVLFCDDLPGSFAVVAVAIEPTTVTIVPNAAVRAGVLPASPAGTPVVRTLSRFDVLQLVTETGHGLDLTGSLVLSDRPVAVFGGSPITFVPDTEVAAEHLEEQLFPIDAWGREYLLVKSKPRTTEPDRWRVVAAVDGTTVTVTPPIVASFTLDAGEHHELVTAGDAHLLASAPVEVGQYLVGAGPTPGASPGDPSMILAVPVQQFGDEHLVLVPETPTTHPEDYLTIVKQSGTSVSLDGGPLIAAYAPIASTGWERAWVRVTDGLHRVDADGPVGVSFYGYGHYAAYGSQAGSRHVATGPLECDAIAGPASCLDRVAVLDASGSGGPGTLQLTWSALTPGVTIAAPEAAVTTAVVDGAGPWLVALTVTNGESASSCFVTIPPVIDTTPPELTCPAIVGSPTTSPGAATVAVLAGALGDCGAPTVTNDRTAGGADATDVYPCGETLVTFTATDASGLAVSCVTRVVVSDAAAPAGLSELPGRFLRVRRDPADATQLEITCEAPRSASEVLNAYGGTILTSGLVAYDHRPLACHAIPTEISPGVARLLAPLEPGTSRYYLVSASNCLGEGTRGSRSDGVTRPDLATDCGAIR